MSNPKSRWQETERLQMLNESIKKRRILELEAERDRLEASWLRLEAAAKEEELKKRRRDDEYREEELKKRRRDDEYREEQARIRLEKMMQERELQNRMYKRQRIEVEMHDWSSSNNY
jgi:hypothetical protein